MKILVIGGTKGFGKNIVDYFSPNSLGIGRSNGYDICDEQSRNIIALKSLEAEIVFLHTQGAQSSHPLDTHQLKMLKKIFYSWKDQKKNGLILTSSSYATFINHTRIREYVVIKQALETYHRQLACQCIHENLPFNMTLVKFGVLNNDLGIESSDNEKANTVSATYFCRMIELIDSFPSSHSLPEIILTTKDSQF